MTAKEFINQVLLNEYARIVGSGFHYVSFALVGPGIEFLGACLDPYEFGIERLSKARFTNAMIELFPSQYRQFSNKLYVSLRCGFVHQLRPSCPFVLTHQRESVREGTTHLGAFGDQTVLIAEELYSDFKGACEEIVLRIDNGTLTHRKLMDKFLEVT